MPKLVDPRTVGISPKAVLAAIAATITAATVGLGALVTAGGPFDTPHILLLVLTAAGAGVGALAGGAAASPGVVVGAATAEEWAGSDAINTGQLLPPGASDTPPSVGPR